MEITRVDSLLKTFGWTKVIDDEQNKLYRNDEDDWENLAFAREKDKSWYWGFIIHRPGLLEKPKNKLHEMAAGRFSKTSFSIPHNLTLSLLITFKLEELICGGVTDNPLLFKLEQVAYERANKSGGEQE